MGRGKFSEQQGREILDLVRHKVRMLVHRTAGSPPDPEEIEGDIVLFVVERLARHNPARSSLRTFACRLVESGYADYWRRRTAAKRDCRREAGSLNVPAYQTDRRSRERGVPLHGTLLGRSQARSANQLSDLKLDLEELESVLSSDQRKLCAKVKDLSIREIADEERVHPGTIYRRLRTLNDLFEDRGLRAYLD